MEYEYEPYERFLAELEDYLRAYAKTLAEKYSRSTVDQHKYVIHFWCEYICMYQGMVDFSGLKLSLVNSKFYSHFQSHMQENLKPVTVSNILKKFLFFIYEEYGIANPELLRKLEKRK